jgi:hypothetical protein
VRENRGAGAGCTMPSTATCAPRATACGCAAASAKSSTGNAHASAPSNTLSHSSRVLVANAARESLAQHVPAVAIVLRRQRFACKAQALQELGVEPRLDGADGQ